jgi:hypothetical protein
VHQSRRRASRSIRPRLRALEMLDHRRRENGERLNSGRERAYTSVASASHRSLRAARAVPKHPTTAVRNCPSPLPSTRVFLYTLTLGGYPSGWLAASAGCPLLHGGVSVRFPMPVPQRPGSVPLVTQHQEGCNRNSSGDLRS